MVFNQDRFEDSKWFSSRIGCCESDANFSVVTLFAVEELANALGEAISSGEKEEAARLSQMLSDFAVAVKVNVDNRAYPSDSIKYVCQALVEPE